MKRKRYPTCTECGCEINPHIYEGCERVYIINDDAYCEACFKEWVREWLDSNPEEVANAIAVDVVLTREEME